MVLGPVEGGVGAVYEIDVLCCPKRGGKMPVIAGIREPESITKIIACRDRQGRRPP
jgi:hypothetical protein